MVNHATSAFCQTTAHFMRNTKLVDLVYPIDACRGFPMELNPQGWPCNVVLSEFWKSEGAGFTNQNPDLHLTTSWHYFSK